MVFGPGDTFFRGGLISKLKRLELLGSGFSGTTHVDTSFEAKVALLKQSFPCWTVQDDAVSKQLSDRNVIFDRFTIFLVLLVERNVHDSKSMIVYNGMQLEENHTVDNIITAFNKHLKTYKRYVFDKFNSFHLSL